MSVIELPLIPREESAVVHDDIRADLGAALDKYFAALDAANREPFIKIAPLFRACWLFVMWVFGWFCVPQIAAANGIIWVIRRIRHAQTPPYLPAWSIAWTANVFRELHRGEIPLMKLVVNRNLVRIFTLFHIRNRMKHLSAHVRHEFVRAAIEGDRDGIRQCDMERRVLETCSQVIDQKAELKLFLFALPLIELAGKTTHVAVDRDFSLTTMTAKAALWIHALDALEAGSLEKLEHASHIFQFASLAAYALFVLVSCFIRKRQIFSELGIFEIEDVLREKNVALPRETPVDIIGWIIVALLLAVAASRNADAMTLLICATLYSAPFAYGLARRLQVKRR